MSGADGRLSAEDIDLDLVAADLAGALDPDVAADLHALLETDPGAARRHAAHTRDLDALAGVLAAEPAPTVPDDVLRRVTAALVRETDVRAKQEAALVAASRAVRTAGRRRRLRGWGAGIGGVVALAGVVALVVQTGLGSSGSSSTTSAAGGDTRAEAAASAGAAPGSAAAGSAPGAGAAGPSTPQAAAPAPLASTGARVVTGANLDATARALYAGSAGSGFRATGPAVAGPSAQAVRPGLGSPTCRPAGTAQSVRLLAESVISFGGQPAVLLVLDPGAGHPGTVRATVVRACGAPALLDRRVSVTG